MDLCCIFLVVMVFFKLLVQIKWLVNFGRESLLKTGIQEFFFVEGGVD
jgi:hypothetical protein